MRDKKILLASTLPQVTDSQLTIVGPITISGGSTVQVMQVALGARLKLKRLTTSDGFACSPVEDKDGAIDNDGTLTLYKTTFSGSSAVDCEGDPGFGGAIYNDGTLDQRAHVRKKLRF